jgi:hypothetical protein
MRDQNRGEDLHSARNGGGAAGEPRPVDSRHFVSTAALQKAFAGAPKIDYKRFREDIDAYVDPTPREWPF